MQVVDGLGQRIVGGDLVPGTVLPREADLSVELGVSRTVVREAVKVLAAKGLVEARPKTGTRVLPRTQWDLADADLLDWTIRAGPDEAFYVDLFEVRALIEPHAAELAARRRTPDQIDRIDALLGQMADSVDNTGEYIEADLAFHSAILGATHNELLAQITNPLSVALRAGRSVTTQVPGGTAHSIPLHRAVAKAIRARNGRAARRAMDKLIAFASKDMAAVVRVPGLDGSGGTVPHRKAGAAR